ncbi:MAG: crotonase/enoyl-CoA hydratase family protein [Saprospiraceae bacterium]
MNDNVKIKIKDHIAVVSLSRPDKMNALDIQMFNNLISIAGIIDNDVSIRCVVIHGEGKSFCAGMDLSNFMDTDPDSPINQPLINRTHGIANIWQKAVYIWKELQVPVIAAVHGVAIGGGLQLMLAADVKYVAPDTKLSIMEMKYGLIPDMAGTQLMRHTVREDVIRELTYTNRMFSGVEAVDFGFATHVSDNPFDAAYKLATTIAEKSPDAIVKAKKLLNAAPYLSQSQGLVLESEFQQQLLKSKNQMEAVFAAMQKRKGQFDDRINEL